MLKRPSLSKGVLKGDEFTRATTEDNPLGADGGGDRLAHLGPMNDGRVVMMSLRFLLAAFFCAALPSLAADVKFPGLPYHQRDIGLNIDRHQIAYTTVAVNNDGIGSVTSKFSNGKKVDGDTFVSYTLFLDKRGRTLAAVRLAAGVNPSYGRRATEKTVSAPFKMSTRQWGRVVTVRYIAKTESNCKDSQFWTKVAEQTAKEAVKYYVTGQPPDAAKNLAQLETSLKNSCRK